MSETLSTTGTVDSQEDFSQTSGGASSGGAPGLAQTFAPSSTSSGSMFTPWGKFSPWTGDGQGDDGLAQSQQQATTSANGPGSPSTGQQSGFGGTGLVSGSGIVSSIGVANGSSGSLPHWEASNGMGGLLQPQSTSTAGLVQRGSSLGSLSGGAAAASSGLGSSHSNVTSALEEVTWSLKQTMDQMATLTTETGALRQALATMVNQMSRMETDSRSIKDRLGSLESEKARDGGNVMRIVELVPGDMNTRLPTISLYPASTIAKNGTPQAVDDGADFFARDGADKWCSAVQEQYNRWVKQSGKVSEADFLRTVAKTLLIPVSFPYPIAITSCGTWEEARAGVMLLFPGPFPKFEDLRENYKALKWTSGDGVTGLANLESKLRMLAARMAVGSMDGGQLLLHPQVLGCDFLSALPQGLRSAIEASIPGQSLLPIDQVREAAERQAPRWLSTQGSAIAPSSNAVPRTAAAVVAAGVASSSGVETPKKVSPSGVVPASPGVPVVPSTGASVSTMTAMGKPGVGGGGTSDSAAGVVCWKCQQPGHRSRACPAQREMRRCHRCLQTGHLAAGCTVPRARLPETSRKGSGNAWTPQD